MSEIRTVVFESQPPLGHLGLHLSVMVPRKEGDRTVLKKEMAKFVGGVFITKDPVLAKAMLEDERCYRLRQYRVRQVSTETLEEQRRKMKEAQEKAEREAKARLEAAARLESKEAKADEAARQSALAALEDLEEEAAPSGGGKKAGGKGGQAPPPPPGGQQSQPQQ